MATINERIKKFLEDISSDPVEERVVEYVIREVHGGRRITEIIDDPYVKNRLSEAKRSEVLENPEVLEALESEIRSAFRPRGVDFPD